MDIPFSKLNYNPANEKYGRNFMEIRVSVLCLQTK